MVVILMLVNIVIMLVIILATTMLQNHFNKIERSLVIYNDEKIYKNENEIEFVQRVIERYTQLDLNNKEHYDIHALIQNTFYQYKIGKFKYNTIHNIALRGKIVLWSILFVQIGIELFYPSTAQNTIQMGTLVVSIIICLSVTVADVFKNINLQREQLFICIKDYIINYYPMYDKEREYKQDIRKLTQKIDQLQRHLEQYEKEIHVTEQMDKKNHAQMTVPIKEENIKAVLQVLSNS